MNKKSLLLAIALAALFFTPRIGFGGPPTAFDFADATKITSLPYTISHPGQYYLGSNCTYSGATDAIIIVSSQVVLNLNGFSIVAKGPATSPDVGIGVAVLNCEDVTIEGPGDIDGFGAYGVLLDATDGNSAEHNFKNSVYNVAFNRDLIGVLCVSGSIDLVEQCDFEGGSIGVYDIASTGGDRYQGDNFQAQKGQEALNLGIGVLGSPGNGILVEDCDIADAQTAAIELGDAKSKCRFDSFFSDTLGRIGGIDAGFATE